MTVRLRQGTLDYYSGVAGFRPARPGAVTPMTTASHHAWRGEGEEI